MDWSISFEIIVSLLFITYSLKLSANEFNNVLYTTEHVFDIRLEKDWTMNTSLGYNTSNVVSIILATIDYNVLF